MFLFQNASAQAALQAASALSGQNETQGGPNTVLRVIIEHMVYPVTLEVLCQVSDGCQITVHCGLQLCSLVEHHVSLFSVVNSSVFSGVENSFVLRACSMHG